MIQSETYLNIADNSGGREMKCIRIFKGSTRTSGEVGDILLGSIRNIRLVRKVKLGEMFFGVIIRTAKEKSYKDGSYTKFKKNSVVLLNKNKQFFGGRIFAPISKNLRRKKYMKLIIMSLYKII